MKIAVIWFICAMVSFILVSMGYTYYHENAHYAIDQNYNVTSSIEYNFMMLGGQVVTAPNQTILCEDNENYLSAHSMNEIVGYNVNMIILSIFAAVFLIGPLLLPR